MKKLKTLGAGNIQSKTTTTITLQSGLCGGNPSTRKISW